MQLFLWDIHLTAFTCVCVSGTWCPVDGMTFEPLVGQSFHRPANILVETTTLDFAKDNHYWLTDLYIAEK